MKLLLDTGIWIWSLVQPESLAPRVRRALENPANEKWLSPISPWELVVLVDKKRVSLDRGVEEWVTGAMQAASFKEAPVTTEVAPATKQSAYLTETSLGGLWSQ